ncbi:MAG: hypothetical protein PHD20_00565, partial [Clostridia bacterium]|nr:hypothetical protein [Clostridia bacterium]
TTWRTYTGQFEMSTGTVIAKSVKKKTGLEKVINKTLAMPVDAMGLAAYDRDDSTYISQTNKYIKVDSSMQGKNIRVYWTAIRDTGGIAMGLRFLNADKVEISSISKRGLNGEVGVFDDIYQVPIGTEWILHTNGGVSSERIKLHEIQPSNEPTFKITNGYPLLHVDPTKAIKSPYQMVTINYFSTSVQRLYKIGTTGEWLSYKEQPVKVNQGQTIYAKGIDQYGNDTRTISSYMASVSDALGMEAIDGNDNTYVCETNKYIKVDSSMQGKNIRVYWTAIRDTGGIAMGLRFLNADKVEISSISKRGLNGAVGVFDDIYQVPIGTEWILHTNGGVSSERIKLHEIQPKI